MNALEEFLTRPGGIADQLKNLRRSANLTGAALGVKVGWSQAKVSKLETGRQKPTPDDLKVWVEATIDDPSTLRKLIEQLDEADAAHSAWQHQVKHGHARIQVNYDELAKAASLIRNFELVFVPGLLQTVEYARVRAEESVRLHGANPAEVDATTLARMQRQQVLYDGSKRFEFVLGESVLRYLICPPAVMRAQLDRLLAAFDMPNVTVAVVPFGVQLATTPQNCFILFDDEAAVETFTSEDLVGGAEGKAYHVAMDRLLAESVTGDEARSLIISAADALP